MNEALLNRFHQCLDPDTSLALAREAGWCKRLGKIHPFEFVYSLTLGQLSAAHPTLDAQAQSLTVPVSRQGIDQRYTPAAVSFFQAVLAHTLQVSLDPQTITSFAQWLQTHFKAVRLFDSTILECAASLAEVFPGCGGRGSVAALKVLLHFEYLHSQFEPLAVLPGTCNDQGLADTVAPHVGPGELGLLDKGFFKGPALQGLQARGGFFLIPWPHGVSVREKDAQGKLQVVVVGDRLRAATTSPVEYPEVYLGQGKNQLGPGRLLAFRLSEESANRRRQALNKKAITNGRLPTKEALELAGWLILVTNAPAEKLPAPVASYLYRVRWQIELVFKQLKSVFRLDVLESENEYRVQCEVWARLLCGVLLFTLHRHANAVCWAAHQREISFDKLAKLIRQMGYALARACFLGGERLTEQLQELWRKIMNNTRKGRQKSRRTTWENLCEHWLAPAPAPA